MSDHATGLTERLDALALRLDAIVETRAGDAAELDSLRRDLTAVRDQVRELEAVRDQHAGQLGALERRDVDHERTIGRLGARVSVLDGKLDGLAAALARIEERIPSGRQVLGAGGLVGVPTGLTLLWQLYQAWVGAQ